jgi:hypothetical protein
MSISIVALSSPICSPHRRHHRTLPAASCLFTPRNWEV